MKMKLIALAVSMIAFNASATSKDCGCTKTPTAYDKTQDVKISGNTSAIADVKLTADQAFDIAVEGRATADNALTAVYELAPQVNNNAKGIADLQESKVDKSVFTADQQRQDKALADAVSKQAATDSKQTSDLKSYADAKATSAYQTSVAHTDAKVARADADRLKGDEVNAAAITAESQARAEENVKLAAGITVAQSTGDYAVSRADEALRNADTNAQAIRNTNAKVAEHSRTLANHEQRLGELERSTSSRFADIDKRIDDNKRSANAGIAAVAAFSNIPQVTGGARFSAGVGVGQRGSEQAVAVGFSSQLTDSVIGKVSVANDSQQQWTVGAGLAVQW